MSASAPSSPPAGSPDPPSSGTRSRGREHDTSFESQLSSLRHSLRTPLNQIIGYAEMLQEEAADAGLEGRVEDVEKIHAAGGQLLVLVNEHLATARVLAGKLDLETLRRDGRTLLNLIVGYSELCQEEEAAAQSRFAEDLGRIRTAAGNLLALLDDPVAFETLRRVPAASTPGAERGPALVRTSPEAPSGAAPLVGKLLVVDDSEMNRDMLSRRLVRQGHTLIHAENGRQALAALRTNRVDLILLDMLMPELDGMETLAEIKRDEALRHTPVIMLSALDEMDSVVRCIEMGADDYLQKPFNPVLLNARINACLEKKRLRDQEQAFLEQLRTEREKSERLLLNILPGSIAERLKQGETTIADNFPDVTVLFADLVEFTRLASSIPAAQLVRLLNNVFSQFDWLAELHGLEKIKTIGDAYMVVGGLPVPWSDHAGAVAEMALDMQKVVSRLSTDDGKRLQLRIGLSSGPVVAGIIGSKKFIYDLWGDTVNIASRMESQGQTGSIHVSESTFQKLRHAYDFQERGRIEVKGRGEMTTYFLLGRKGS